MRRPEAIDFITIEEHPETGQPENYFDEDKYINALEEYIDYLEKSIEFAIKK